MGETPLCRLFLKGKCRRGNACRFRHDKEANLADEDEDPEAGGSKRGSTTSEDLQGRVAALQKQVETLKKSTSTPSCGE